MSHWSASLPSEESDEAIGRWWRARVREERITGGALCLSLSTLSWIWFVGLTKRY